MNTRANFTGYLLAIAGSTFWFSWFLMPDPDTMNSVDILNTVKHARNSVYYSSVFQVISSVLYLTALFFLAHIYGGQLKLTLAGIILFGIGAMGMCAEAFFHLLTYYMTDETVNIDDGIIQVMNFMQDEGISILMPLLLSFFIGSFLLALGLSKQGEISKIPLFLNVAAISIVPISAIVAKTSYFTDGSLISLSMLGLVATSHTFLGSELIISIKDQQDNII